MIFLKNLSKLGSYSQLTFPVQTVLGGDAGSVQVIVESEFPHLENIVKRALELVFMPKDLSYSDVLLILENRALDGFFLGGTSDRRTLRELLSQLRSEGDRHYLEELLNKPEARVLALPILGQILFEKYTHVESRLVVLLDDKGEHHLTLAVKLMGQADVMFLAVNGSQISHLTTADKTVDRDFIVLESIESGSQPARSGSKIPLIGFNGRRVEFTVSGRSPTDKRFAEEERISREAAPSDLVPMEIYFHPFYRAFGHTTVRFGQTLYELTSTGWKSHGSPTDSARAFLFNNPFFKSQYARFRSGGMPPLSLGKTVHVPKEIAIRIQLDLENQVAATGLGKSRFNIVVNNCNQGILRSLNRGGFPEFQPGTIGLYETFSSVLTFRRFLWESEMATEGHRIYLLPQVEATVSQVRSMIPRQLYRQNGVGREIARAWPIYAVDITTGPIRWMQRRWAEERATNAEGAEL